MSRLLALHANPKGKATLDVLWDGATAMVKDTDAPGNINQALIELGATVCKPRDPLCKSCPLSRHCNAFSETQVSVVTVSFFVGVLIHCEGRCCRLWRHRGAM